jgi:Fur family ferric uptake transcriptional regulator
MKRIHTHEKEQFKKLFRQDRVDRFEDRHRILEVFLQTENHITHSGLMQLLEADGYQLEPDFVAETLKLMCHFGFAQANRFENGELRYEHRHLGQHHDHMICTKCKKIIEFEDDALEKRQRQIASSNGFHILQHKMEMYGICAACLAARDNKMPLVSAKPGEMLVITGFTGGSNARMRLMTMGLRIGDVIEVITNNSAGQVVVAINYHRYAVGRGLAQKVQVEPVNATGGDSTAAIAG